MRYLLTLAITLCILSCSNETEKKFESVLIQTVYKDSLSIRAISPIDENRVWFAANNGKVGLIDGNIPKLATIKYEDRLLHFRAISAQKNAVFVLSIENPGLLYKIGFNGQEATNIELVYSELGEKVFYDAMAFFNEKEGIAMGDPTDGCLSIIVTVDGGNTWSKISCENLPAVAQGEAAFAASNSNIAIYNNTVWICTGGKKSRVFKSEDKGLTWDVYDTPIVQGKAMTGIYSIDFYNEMEGVIFGGDWENKANNTANKAITKNGGKTWKLMADGNGPGYRSSVKFVPGSEGKAMVAIGSPGVSYSNDKGNTWTALSDEGFFALEFVNDSIAFASGNSKISKLTFKYATDSAE